MSDIAFKARFAIAKVKRGWHAWDNKSFLGTFSCYALALDEAVNCANHGDKIEVFDGAQTLIFEADKPTTEAHE